MMQGARVTKKQNNQNEYENAVRYIVYLLRCALNQKELRDLPVKCTWETVWRLAERNCIEALIGNYIQKYGEMVPAEIRNEGKKAYNATLYRQLYFDFEREKIVKELENQKLAYLMLKGINISKYYPQTGIRWMSDNDILCSYIQMDEGGGYRIKGETSEEIQYWEKKARNDIQIVMEKCGFSLKQKGPCHDAYIKQPMFKFEMHHQLFLKSFDEVKAEYYQNPWKKAILDEQSSYLYYYSKEDEYLYFITHAYKHFSGSGSGIRTLTDLYVYIKNNTSMDWAYISSQLKILELEEFEKLLQNTAMQAFSVDGKITEEEWNVISYMLGSGTFGTSQNRIRHCLESMKLNDNKVWHYIKDRLWLDESVIKESFPFFYRHRILRVFMPLYRIMRGMLVHPRKIWVEWEILFRTVKNNK